MEVYFEEWGLVLEEAEEGVFFLIIDNLFGVGAFADLAVEFIEVIDIALIIGLLF